MEEKVHCRMLRRTLNLALKHNEKLDALKNRPNILEEQRIETNGTMVKPSVKWEPNEDFWAEVVDNHPSSSDEEEETVCNCRGRGRMMNISPRLPSETSVCTTDFVSTSYGKGRGRIIRDNMSLIKENPQVGFTRNQQIIIDKPAPVPVKPDFSKPEKMYQTCWNDEDFPALGSAAVTSNESLVLSKNSSSPIILDTHKVNNTVSVFSDSVSHKPNFSKSVKVTSKTQQVPTRGKESLKSLSQLPEYSDMSNMETANSLGDTASYDEGLMNMYLRNSFASSRSSHFSSSSAVEFKQVRNELSHMQSDAQLSSNDSEPSSAGDNTDVSYTNLDHNLPSYNKYLEDNIDTNSNNNYEHITTGIEIQSFSDSEKADIMRQHIDHYRVANCKQSDDNENTSNIKGKNTYKSTVDKEFLERKKYKQKRDPESHSNDDCFSGLNVPGHKWKVKGEFVIQVDGLPPNPNLSGLEDLIGSFGTVFDNDVSNQATGSSARFKLDKGESCDYAVECLHNSVCLYPDSNRVLICYRISL